MQLRLQVPALFGDGPLSNECAQEADRLSLTRKDTRVKRKSSASILVTHMGRNRVRHSGIGKRSE
ncbi:hypothetical protein [Tardiphaga sp.]|jgi:hypothetical protein|uniref:hypothetical protein n=1 Tax=Tardiphaga sp. TaxID=1926292 RepID=UPI0037DA01DB